jgi:hypothetical protein
MKWLLNGCGSKGAARFREPILVLLDTHCRNLLEFIVPALWLSLHLKNNFGNVHVGSKSGFPMVLI